MSKPMPRPRRGLPSGVGLAKWVAVMAMKTLPSCVPDAIRLR